MNYFYRIALAQNNIYLNIDIKKRLFTDERMNPLILHILLRKCVLAIILTRSDYFHYLSREMF